MAKANRRKQVASLNEQTLRLQHQGQHAQALENAAKAYELSHRHLDPKQLEYLTSIMYRAGVNQALGNFTAAEPLYREALACLREQGDEEGLPVAAFLLTQLALLHLIMNSYAEAEQFFEQALAAQRSTLGEDHPDVAVSLNHLANLSRRRADYAKAERLHVQALELQRRTLGEGHQDVAMSLSNLAGLYQETGRHAEAMPLFQQAREIFRNTVGEAHSDFAVSLINLAALHSEMGEYAEAERLYNQALPIFRAGQEPDRERYGTCLGNLGELYLEMGDYARAGPVLQEALDIRRAMLGEEHPDVALSLNNLAGLHKSMGNYEAAGSYLRQALEIWRRTVGEKHPRVATALHNLAGLWALAGNYPEAQDLYRQALDIKREAFGEGPELAKSLRKLADVQTALGNYVDAERCHRQALEIQRRSLGEWHPDHAGELHSLAGLYRDMGDREEAERLYRQVLEIDRRTVGEKHPYYAVALSSLGGLCALKGDYPQAELLYGEALRIEREVLGEKHPDFAAGLSHLGELCRLMGRSAEAESLHRRALEIRRTALGEDHPDFAESLNNLALIHKWGGGDSLAAEPLYRQALEIQRKVRGEEHPAYINGLYNLAVVFAATDREAEALRLMEEASALQDRLLGRAFAIGSERQRLAHLATLQKDFYAFLSLILQHRRQSADARRSAFDLVLRRKAIGAEALAAQRAAVLGGRYPELAPRFRELTGLRMQIAQQELAGPAQPGPDGLLAHGQMLAQWNARKELLETELARQVPEMSLDLQAGAVDRPAVARALQAGEALVELVRFHPFNFKAIPGRGDALWEPARYLAFILRAGCPDDVRMLDLGEAGLIDPLIRDFRAEITGEKGRGRDRNLLPEEDLPPAAPAGPSLYAALFEPLLPDLGEGCRFFLAPDGELTQLPFEVLPLPDGRRVIEAYTVSYLSCARDLGRFRVPSVGQPTEPLVVADPDFNLAVDGPAELTAGKGSRLSRSLDDQQVEFSRLDGTLLEGREVAEILGIEPWLGPGALESPLKARQSPWILHLATHGFFLENQEGGTGGALGRLAEVRLENPMLRSGLVLAGANTWLRKGRLPDAAEDGFLTAEDVAGLDLLETDLVVLSACDTGLGAVQVGEGVFGLRRSFHLSGARTLVMSLWKVPDGPTQELMGDYYRRLKCGQPRAEALRQAQLTIKGRYPHPRNWGAFICQGDPGPLQR
ncbi:MAG TPA: tetratricopeptide repeat protein [Thermoanaerobaculia bacterium]|nr:tetratricopeptide repeat protein [Thermoanaerobaculia bacterium]